MNLNSALVYRKQSDTPEGVDRLSVEAAILKSITHPNVVELIGVTITDGKASLRLAEVEATPLAETDLSLTDYGRVIMSAAATLAHLHACGVTHNRLNETHILVRETDKTAILCGFGGATFTDEPFAQTADTVALASMLRNHVVGNQDPFRARINGRVHAQADLSLSLRTMAEMGADGEMTALALADALRSVLEGSPSLRPPAHRKAFSLFSKNGPWKVALLVLIPLAFVGVGIVSLGGHSKAGAQIVAPAPGVTVCDAIAKDATPIDTDGDGCPNAVYFGKGVVTVDDQRYEVGNPTDQLVAGDWRGTGLSTLALLRPESGQIFLFDSWPASGATTAPVLLATVDGAISFTDKRSGHHDVMIVNTTHGDVTVDATVTAPGAVQ